MANLPPARALRLRRGVLALALAGPLSLLGASEGRRAFDVPAGDAIETLKRAARQGGVEIVFLAEAVRGVRTQPVQGEFTPREALDRLVVDTGLVVSREPKTGTLTVQRAPVAAPPPRSSAQRATSHSSTMKTRNLLSLLASWLAAGSALAQTAPANQATSAPSSTEPEVVVLSPFTITAESSTGYQASTTLVGGRMAMNLSDVPVSVSVLTRDFLDDIRATDFASSAKWLASADVDTGSRDNPFNDYGISIRGFRSGFPYRNFFISYINTDGYAIERLDSARGPNALVFGDTKVGGTVNTSTKQAKATPITRFEYSVNSEGGVGRVSFDVNRAVTDNLYVRLAGLYGEEDDWQDFTGTERRGLYGTVTYKPFQKTTVRLEGEVFRQERRIFGAQVFDNISNWDGITTYTAAGAAIPGTGTSAINANFHRVYTPGSPSLGVVNWQGFNTTQGSGYLADVYAPAYVNAARFPTLPYRGWNMRFNNADVEQPYTNLSAYVEQQIGDNLFLEFAYSHSDNERQIDQFVTSDVRVDINRNLPNGQPNPNFGKRYADTGGPTNYAVQGNVLDEFRVSSAYLLNTSWSKHRFFLGGGYRRDAYRDSGGYLALDEPGLRVGNPFLPAQAPFLLRLRIYEDQRGSDFALPANARVVKFSFFPGEDKDLAYGQFAASSSWFKDGRLKTLVGVRHDKLRTKGVTANLSPTTGEIVSINERLPGREFKPVISRSAGASYTLTRNLAPYFNYAEGFDTSNAGNMLNPETGGLGDPLPDKVAEGIEFGLRYRFLDGRLTGALAYYQNEQTNDSNTGVSFPRNEINNLWNVIDNVNPSPRQIPFGPAETIDYKGDGFEFDAIANPLPNLRVFFNLAFPKTEIEGGWARTIAYVNANMPAWEAALASLVAAGDTRATAFQNNLNTIRSRVVSVGNGRPLPGTFDYTSNLFVNYDFRSGPLKNWRVGGGVNIRGERLVQSTPTVATDAGSVVELKSERYELFTALIGYRTRIWNRKVDFQLNVENVFDEQFKRYTGYNLVNNPTLVATPTFVGNGYYLQAPRKFLFTTRIDF